MQKRFLNSHNLPFFLLAYLFFSKEKVVDRLVPSALIYEVMIYYDKDNLKRRY
ncbi:MAG: hypothetical protein ABH952_05870 [Candidatus Omnitrophota bacterium]